jgi:hypothetical protein
MELGVVAHAVAVAADVDDVTMVHEPIEFGGHPKPAINRHLKTGHYG